MKADLNLSRLRSGFAAFAHNNLTLPGGPDYISHPLPRSEVERKSIDPNGTGFELENFFGRFYTVPQLTPEKK